MEKSFERWERYLKASAYKAARYTTCAMDDAMSEAFLIFAKALETHDPAKGAFSTHLISRLRELPARCRSLAYRQPTNAPRLLVDTRIECDVDKIFRERKKLSREADEILEWIFGVGLAPDGRVPRENRAVRELRGRFSTREIARAWEELRRWWTNIEAEVVL